MRIAYDPDANAMSVILHPVKGENFGQTEVNENGAIVDVDASGAPRAYEFLCVRENGVPLDDLPESVAGAITKFISLGALESAEFVAREIE